MATRKSLLFLVAILLVASLIVYGEIAAAAVYQNTGAVVALHSLHSGSARDIEARRAIQFLEHARRLNSELSPRLLGRVYYAGIGDGEHALSVWKATESNFDPISALWLGDVYFERGEPNLAVRYWTLASAAPELVGRAVAQRDSEHFDTARTLLHLAIRVDPNSYDARLRLGELYQQAKEWHLAIEQYARAIQINPDRPYPYYALAVAAQSGELEPQLILDHLLVVWRLEPGWNEWLYVRIGKAYQDQGNCKNAKAWYERGLERFPASSPLSRRLADLETAQACN